MPGLGDSLRAVSAPASFLATGFFDGPTVSDAQGFHGSDAGVLDGLAGLPPELVARFQRSSAALRAATDATANFASSVEHGQPLPPLPPLPKLPDNNSANGIQAELFWQSQLAQSELQQAAEGNAGAIGSDASSQLPEQQSFSGNLEDEPQQRPEQQLPEQQVLEKYFSEQQHLHNFLSNASQPYARQLRGTARQPHGTAMEAQTLPMPGSRLHPGPAEQIAAPAASSSSGSVPFVPKSRPKNANVNGGALEKCNGVRLCLDNNNPFGKQVCAEVNDQFTKEVGHGPLAQLQMKTCINTRELGEWIRGDHDHRGIGALDCDATSANAIQGGDEEAARFLFSQCPKAQQFRVPHWPRWTPEDLPLPGPNPKWPKFCNDPIVLLGDILGPIPGRWEHPGAYSFQR